MFADLTARVLFDIFHLSVACNSPNSRLKLLPLPDLLDIVFGGLISGELLDSVSLAFDEDTPDLTLRLSMFCKAIDAAATQDSTIFERFERAVNAIETLFVIQSITSNLTLSEVRVLIHSSMVFRFFRYIVLSSPAERPVVVLVGGVASAEERLEIPLEQETFSRLQLAYINDEPHPRWKTDLWVRLPPDPYKRRFAEWLPDDLIGAGAIELYRRQIPGEGPVFTLNTERVEYPRSLATPTLDLLVEPAGSGLYGWRTTVHDKFQALLLIAERVVRSR